MKASGVNNHTKARLKALMAEDYTAEEISDMIQVEQSSVESWMGYFSKTEDKVEEKKDKPKKKTLKEKITGK